MYIFYRFSPSFFAVLSNRSTNTHHVQRVCTFLIYTYQIIFGVLIGLNQNSFKFCTAYPITHYLEAIWDLPRTMMSTTIQYNRNYIKPRNYVLTANEFCFMPEKLKLVNIGNGNRYHGNEEALWGLSTGWDSYC